MPLWQKYRCTQRESTGSEVAVNTSQRHTEFMRDFGYLSLIAMLWILPAPLHADPPAEHPACIEVTSHAQYSGFGYNHVVHLHNTCASAASCSVTTNVNPQPVSVQLAVGAATDLLTFRGSPASAFEAHAVCTLASGGQPR